MAIHTITRYVLHCDIDSDATFEQIRQCHGVFTKGSTKSYTDVIQLTEDALESEWEQVGDKWYCSHCASRVRSRVTVL